MNITIDETFFGKRRFEEAYLLLYIMTNADEKYNMHTTYDEMSSSTGIPTQRLANLLRNMNDVLSAYEHEDGVAISVNNYFMNEYTDVDDLFTRSQTCLNVES